ncbi:MAG: response regulator transcription factor, partial [Herpetosiphon sp.]|nr:response regulator transcription factor [Herpetosiphon sp.]
MITLFLIDDHRVVRRGLRTLLESYPDMQVIGEASNAESAFDQVATLQPSVIVLDILMPGGMDGIKAAQHLREHVPNSRIVMLTSYTDDARVVAAMRSGAHGFVRKDSEPEELVAAVRAVAAGRSYLDPDATQSMWREVSLTRPEALTEREHEVLLLLANGYSNRVIATTLQLGTETIKTHV